MSKRAGERGLHGQNNGIRDGVKKVPYYSKCSAGPASDIAHEFVNDFYMRKVNGLPAAFSWRE